LGTIWIDEPAGAPYFLSSITANSANWVGTSAGTGTFLAVTVNPGDIDVTAGDVNIDAGNLAVTAGNATIGGDLTVAGTTTLNGDIDITTAALFDITSTLDAAPSILLEANGGVSEQIRLYSNQGTAADSIYLFSNAGGITLRADLASDDALNLTAPFGGLDVDCALQINIASSESAVDAIVISALAGGIDITASGTAGEDIDITNSASVNLASSEAVADAITITASHAAGGVTIDAGTGGIEIGNTATCSPIDIGDFVPTASRLITVGGGTVTTAVTDRVDIAVDGVSTNAGAVKQVDIASGNILLGSSTVNINSGTALTGSSTVNISTGTGGGTKAVSIGNADALTTFNVDAITLINDSVNANVSICTGTSTGVVALGNSLAGAVTVDSAAGISLDAATASNFTVTGAADLTLLSTLGSAILSSGEAAVDAIRINASNAAGGIDADCGTGGATLDSTGAVSIQAAAASDFSVSGAGVDLSLVSAAGRVVVNGEEAAADAVRILSAAGGLDANVALQMNLDSSQAAAANSVRIVASAADGGMDIDAGTGGITIDSTGAVSIDGALASNFSAAAGDLTLAAATNSVVISGAEAVIDAVQLTASNGAVRVTGGALAATTGLNIVQGAASALVQVGAGAPAHNAPKGSLYLRTDGSGVNDRAYIATDAVGTWTAIVTVA
jgi:hypothetical protein